MTEHHDGHDRSPEDHPDQRGEDAHNYDVAYKASKQAVEDVFQRLGIDHQDWKEVQKDNAFVRKLRTNCDSMVSWITRGVIAIVFTFIAGVVLAAFKFKMGK